MRILFLGDSIMQYNDCTTYPQFGWAQMFTRFLTPDTVTLNFAKNGRSTKSFIDEGRFDEVLEKARNGDVAIVSFAHNDEHTHNPVQYTDSGEGGTFRKNLEFMVTSLRKKGVLPVLMTPVARRSFDENGKASNSHSDYPDAVRAVAEKMGVPLIDMTTLTTAELNRLGEQKSRRFYMNFEKDEYDTFPEGKNDNSHLRADGAYMVSRFASQELTRIASQREDYSALKDVLITTSLDKETYEKETNDK